MRWSVSDDDSGCNSICLLFKKIKWPLVELVFLAVMLILSYSNGTEWRFCIWFEVFIKEMWKQNAGVVRVLPSRVHTIVTHPLSRIYFPCMGSWITCKVNNWSNHSYIFPLGFLRLLDTLVLGSTFPCMGCWITCKENNGGPT